MGKISDLLGRLRRRTDAPERDRYLAPDSREALEAMSELSFAQPNRKMRRFNGFYGPTRGLQQGAMVTVKSRNAR